MNFEKRKFYIKTLGCKANQLESAVIAEKLCSAGYEQTYKHNEAQIYILNSCSVTENADIDALRLLRHEKTNCPEVLTVLTGCVAQLSGLDFDKLRYADIILGNDDKFCIVEALNAKESSVSDIFTVKKFNNQFVHEYSKTRGYLKIQDGCNNYCTYCTIPFARGISRSNSVENILSQLAIYTGQGIKEAVLTGIHIGQWGADLSGAPNLKDLLAAIEESNIVRYRLGSLNPLEITDELLCFLSRSEKFCPHFHLSLQSMNTKTLKAMNRHYTAPMCLELIEKLNSLFKNPFIGCDVIVGFPGESESDFDETFENLKTAELSAIHVFPYSIRKNTKAAQMPEQLPLSVKKQRAEILHVLGSEKTERFIEKNIGQTAEILIEKRLDKKTGCLKGVTRNYLNVLLDSADKNLCNTIQNVKILKFEAGNLFCNIIEG